MCSGNLKPGSRARWKGQTCFGPPTQFALRLLTTLALAAACVEGLPEFRSRRLLGATNLRWLNREPSDADAMPFERLPKHAEIAFKQTGCLGASRSKENIHASTVEPHADLKRAQFGWRKPQDQRSAALLKQRVQSSINESKRRDLCATRRRCAALADTLGHGGHDIGRVKRGDSRTGDQQRRRELHWLRSCGCEGKVLCSHWNEIHRQRFDGRKTHREEGRLRCGGRERDRRHILLG